MISKNDVKKEDLEITYKIRENNKEKIRIFVENNINKCKIVYDNKEYQLKEYLEVIEGQFNHKDPITFKLRGFYNITDISYIFNECDSLTSLSFADQKNESNSPKETDTNDNNFLFSNYNINNMSFMFYGCNELEYHYLTYHNSIL